MSLCLMKSDPTQFKMKMLVSHGLNFGCHGAKVHAYHHTDYLYERTFELGHKLAGLSFMSLANMPK